MELVDLVNSGEITNDFRWLTFILGSLTVTLNISALLDFFLSSDASICSAISFLPLGNSDCAVF